MPNSDNGPTGQESDAPKSPRKFQGTRSASPAKRSAADMEGYHDSGSNAEYISTQDAASSETTTQSLNGAAPGISSFGSGTSTTSASVDREQWNYSTEEINSQVRQVQELQSQPLDAGQRGLVVSNKWLERVLSRTSDGLNSSEFSKDAREGPIGHVDNSDIVQDGAFEREQLRDAEGHVFIPLKPGLSMGTEFEVLNDASWGEVMASYGLEPGQQQITRYVRNTAPVGSPGENLQYELYPPIFTIRKVPAPDTQEDNKATSAIDDLRKKAERKYRGQDSADDAARLVSSRQERFQTFLRRSKEAAEIPASRKVRVWKVLDESMPQATQLPDRPLSPPQSRENSRQRKETQKQRLVMEALEFKDLEIGKNLELLNVSDETDNSKYNGNSTMDTFDLSQDATILLEEMIGGPGGGDFASASDPKKSIKSILNRKSESKPNSTANSGRSSPAPAGRGMMTRGRQRRDGRTRGIVGMNNLGNTCYMNSALQCIRSVEELTIYFLSDMYKKEINTDNPLGHNGVMAKQYAGVLQSIYGDNAGSTCSPNSFKKTLGHLQPLFSGFGQQDSQEFLSFLVDALHEDLNRIHKKPYIENPDSNDDTVHDPQAIVELGEIYRTNHGKRNDSVAMDLFNGFYKNTMECPECSKISITFDPYSLVTLQLPAENTFQHIVTFVPLHGTPVNHAVDVDRNSTIKALKENIASKYPGVDPERLWMAEIYNHKLFKVFDNATTLAEANIGQHDFIFMFELDNVPSNAPTQSKKKSFTYSPYRSEEPVPGMDDPRANQFAVPVFSRQKNRFGSGWDMIMHPMYIVLTRDEAKDYNIVLKKVLIAVSRLTSLPILKEFGSRDVTMINATTPGADVEDNAQISEHSLPSEDGYVEVSLSQEQNGHILNGDSGASAFQTASDRCDPPTSSPGFDFDLTPELRTQFFTMKYGDSDSDGMYCTGMTGIQEKSIRVMHERVRVVSRRDSLQSDSSEDSSASTASNPLSNGEVDETDAGPDDPDKPADEIASGAESYLSVPTPARADDESDNESLNDNTFTQLSNARSGRRKNGKGRKNRNAKTYSRKDRSSPQKRHGNTQTNRPITGRNGQVDDENPYFIKLGEGIILDWFPEALKELFEGDPKDDVDTRGHFVSSHDGKNLPTLNDPIITEKRRKREERRKNGITLEDCFTESGRRERLSEDNAWYCNRCKKLQQATKTLEIWTIPDILVVHFKRFGGNRSFRDKIDTMVDYPIEGLDMTDRVGCKEPGKEYIYDLFAVDNHFGGLGGGHYTAMAKNFYDGQWYDYNDASTHKLNERSLHSAAAYLLFYRRRSNKPLGPQYLQDLVLASRGVQTTPDQVNDDTADESEAGEGKLGGPTSLRGSSSNSTAAGAAATTAHGHAGGSVGATRRVGSNQTTKTSDSDNMIDGRISQGPRRLSQTLESKPTWGFGDLDNVDDEDSGDDVQHNMGGPIDEDAASITAEANSMGAGSTEDLDQDFADFESDNGGIPAWSMGQELLAGDGNWPDAQEDDHAMYSDAHAREDGASFGSLHLENAGAIFGNNADFGNGADQLDPPPVDIVVDNPTSSPPLEGLWADDGHAKLD